MFLEVTINVGAIEGACDGHPSCGWCEGGDEAAQVLPLLRVVGRGQAVAPRPALRPRPRPARRVAAQVVTTALELQSAVTSALYSELCHT